MLMLRYVKCSPGGNTTVLVFSEVERALQPSIAKRIMSWMEDVEQVGFVEEPENSLAVARLQMMGGEFCGNATRSLAWVLWKKAGIDKRKGAFFLEVSGANRPVQVEISGKDVRVEMPIKRDFGSVKQKGNYTIVELEGISHVIVDQAPPPNAKNAADQLLNQLNLKSLEAAGVLYCQPRGSAISMTPIVWVRDTGTLVEETACASGTVCVALAEAKRSQQDRTLTVYQPSGKPITASVSLASDKQSFSEAYIEGPVDVLGEGVTILP